MNIKKGVSETVKTLLKNGTVVSGDMSVREDVLIDGEKIVKVGRNLEAEDAQVVDVNGKLSFSGIYRRTYTILTWKWQEQ